ncbi:clathrin coat assembly protein, putative [Bodo saltans]|uniref:Clathrin coat assembly protein, putative n=1 Tax=Bodo saltans TaxID=75058 RepID=A0A0S4J0L1_BODSA|nr:clathrin coat assembly protein, putative [Bodo saltans]|eukprot:CUG06418.1 clathrin coat assembly protein, putative [Bodo saltans]
MERLLQATFGQYNSGSVDHGDVNRYILEELEKRTHTHNWVVVLKTFVALHRIMSEGSVPMQTAIGHRLGIFCGRNIKDLADSPEGAAQKTFIEQYIRYLEELSITQHKMIDAKITARISDHVALLAVLTPFTAEDLLQPFELLLVALEVLVKVEFRASIVDNFLTMESYRMLVVDGKRLYHILTNRIMYVLEVFEDQPLSLKNKWFKMYGRFDDSAKKLGRLFDQMGASPLIWGETIPSLKLLPESILRKLEDDIKYSDVQSEDLSALLGKSAVTEDRGPRVRSASPPQPEPAVAAPQPPVKAEPELPPPVVPVSVRKPIDDLFGPPVAPPVAQPVAPPVSVVRSVSPPRQGTSPAVSPTQQRPITSEDLFGPSAAPSVAATTSSRATAPPPADDGFDPFAPPPVPVTSAESPAGNNVDFFFSNATPQQQYATQNTRATTQHPPAPGSNTAFSEFAPGRQGGRAW